MTPFNPADDPLAFRAALGRFPTGVSIVTAMENGRPIGITANSFASVSLDPALVLWSPAKASNRHDAFVGAQSFCIHVLAKDQLDVCTAFVRSRHGFDGLDHTVGENGAPLIADTLAVFECQQSAVHEAGDHSIIIGRVSRAQYRDGEALIFKDGAFDLPV